MSHFVIPIAGAGQRFKDIGVVSPKWSLKIDNVPILELAIRSLPLESADTLTIILLREHQKAAEKIVNEIHGMPIVPELVTIPEIQNGQALTVLKAIKLSAVIENSNLVIWCGDCFILNNSFANIPRLGNWLTTTRLSGDHWSFARVDNGVVVETSEKKRISDNASVGLYGFQDKNAFENAINYRKTEKPDSEIYVAPLYNALIKLGQEIRIHEIGAEDFVSAGTPEEITRCCALYDWTLPQEVKDAYA